MRNRLHALAICISATLASTNAYSAQIIDLQKLTPLGAEVQELKSDKPKLLYFWATWCSDCRAKLAGPLDSLKAKTGTEIIAVNTDKDRPRAVDYVAKEAVKLPVARDESKEIMKTLKIFSIPSWAVVRKTNNGWLVERVQVGSDLSAVESALKGIGND